MGITTIDEVITRLSAIVGETAVAGDRRGYFAALYRQVTIRVRDGIAAGAFADGDRMARLDVAFAARYFEAYDAFRAGEACTRSWQLALRAAAQDELTILQHLLLGMNAHINLDLGIAAAAVAGPADPAFERDFRELNRIISGLVDASQAAIARFAPLMDVLDRIGGRGDEHVADFKIAIARGEAWEVCQALLRRDADEQARYIERLDRRTELLGKLLRGPQGPLAHALALVRSTERGSVADVIAELDALAAS